MNTFVSTDPKREMAGGMAVYVGLAFLLCSIQSRYLEQDTCSHGMTLTSCFSRLSLSSTPYLYILERLPPVFGRFS